MRLVSRAIQIACIVVGLLLIVLGMVGLLLPTHLLGGLTVIGLILVLRNSRSARRRFVVMKRRYPRWGHPLRRLLRRKPEVWPVLWHELLRAERILPPRFRRLRRWRRRLRGERVGPVRAVR